jgi:histidinol-phosphatase (PHP family)
LIVDYHLHLRGADERIAHDTAAVEPFVETAARSGVDEIGFTEHVYYFRQTRAIWDRPYQTERCVYDLEAYVDAVVEAKRQGLPVKLGLEVGGLSIDSAPDRGIWAETPVDQVWRRYLAALAELAGSGHVDVLAHPDLAKIFGRRPDDPPEYPPLDGVALEISTAGLHKPVGELYPDLELLEAMRLPITLASDAHVPANVGRDFDRALELARAAGYETVTVFEGRTARQEPLG